MSFPRRLLTDDEEVVVELRPHWAFLGRPLVVAVAVVALAIAVVVAFSHAPVGVLYVLLALVAVLGPVAGGAPGALVRHRAWWSPPPASSQRSGVLGAQRARAAARAGQPAVVPPVARRPDPAHGRAAGGDGGETGVVVFDHVPRPAAVQSVITEQIDAMRHRAGVPITAGPVRVGGLCATRTVAAGARGAASAQRRHAALGHGPVPGARTATTPWPTAWCSSTSCAGAASSPTPSSPSRRRSCSTACDPGQAGTAREVRRLWRGPGVRPNAKPRAGCRVRKLPVSLGKAFGKRKDASPLLRGPGQPSSVVHFSRARGMGHPSPGRALCCDEKREVVRDHASDNGVRASVEPHHQGTAGNPDLRQVDGGMSDNPRPALYGCR